MLAKILEWLGFGSQAAPAGHSHGHGHASGEGGHGHTHGVMDATIASTSRGIWAIKWSFIILAITAVLQLIVVYSSGSVALLADAIHNVGDAGTAIPLWVAFLLARRPPTRTFAYGYGKVEDVAGVLIVLIILFSAIVAGYEAIDRLFHPHAITNLWWVAIAGVIGFVGNEVVAVFRIRTGREINSAALIADGYHARTDGLTSLAVVAGAAGVAAGYPLADPIVGLLITFAIFGIVWQSAKSVFTRMLDGLEPGTLDEITHAAAHVDGVRIVNVRARWLGHKLHADVAIDVEPRLSLVEAKALSEQVREELFDHLPALAGANVRFATADDAESSLSDHGHHAPDPVSFKCAIADGVLEIVDTSDGERMRLTILEDAPGLTATVTIERPYGPEILPLAPMSGSVRVFLSNVPPLEPHSFIGKLALQIAGKRDDVNFSMTEPDHK